MQVCLHFRINYMYVVKYTNGKVKRVRFKGHGLPTDLTLASACPSQACLRSLRRQMAELQSRDALAILGTGDISAGRKKAWKGSLAWTRLNTAESVATGDKEARQWVGLCWTVGPYLWQGQCLHQASDCQAKRQLWRGGGPAGYSLSCPLQPCILCNKKARQPVHRVRSASSQPHWLLTYPP